MRSLVLSLSAFLLLAACDRSGSGAKTSAEPATPAVEYEATLSDELPGLTSPATGIAFWEHPTLSFNSVMIVANGQGVVSYNMEDGNEVARLNGYNAAGAAVGYLGLGNSAAGFVAFLDVDDSAFRFFGIDNASRNFLPLTGGPDIRGAVRGFCLGRAETASAPTLFVLQKSKIQIFNLEATADGVSVAGSSALETPDNLVSCAVDVDGVLLLAANDGAIYRLVGDDTFAAPFARAGAGDPGDLALLAAKQQTSEQTEEATSISGQIILLDKADGALHVFDRTDGASLGKLNFVGTDVLAGVTSADVAGISGVNLGAIYRDGIIAFGVEIGGVETGGVQTEETGPMVRMAPANSLFNALELPIRTSVSPRGEAPVVEDTGLIINTDFPTE